MALEQLKIVSNPRQIFSASLINNLINALVKLDVAAPLVSFTFLRTSTSPYNVYTYAWVTIDARTWTQTFTFDVSGNPKMTFNFTSQFRLSEFSPHQEVRDQVIYLASTINLTEISALFNP